jgi:hypothetical protein
VAAAHASSKEPKRKGAAAFTYRLFSFAAFVSFRARTLNFAER